MNKEKCVNKKLHPYWKTGIYGWLGEEVDDNDYMCCPICGEILAMNYWDYSAEHDGDNKCPRCGQELDYSEIYDFEDTLYFRQLLEMKDKQIAEKDDNLHQIYSRLGVEAFGEDIHEQALKELSEKEKLLRQKIGDMKSTDFIRMFVENGFIVRAKEIDNQTAIDELEKLLEKTQTLDVMVQSGHYINQKKVNVVFKDTIDQQIKKLKGE